MHTVTTQIKLQSDTKMAHGNTDEERKLDIVIEEAKGE